MTQKTLKEEAQAYEPQQKTKNIAELDRVSTALVVEEDSFLDNEDKEVKIKVVTVDGEKYRVPVSVLSALKVMMEDNPSLENFKVKKTGEGMDTRYTVIPLV